MGNIDERPSIRDNQERCHRLYENWTLPEGPYCNYTWDNVLCWPPTAANTTTQQPCPAGMDSNRSVWKRCLADARWEGRNDSSPSPPQGWTNYFTCFPDDLRFVFEQLYHNGGADVKYNVAVRTRALEIVGLSVSLAALLASLAIFCHFRSLRNNRTRIHKNLFVAMTMQVVIRLAIYIDKGFNFNSAVLEGGALRRSGFLHNTPILCEASYVLMEYARTAMFLWMFIEGLYLHNMITVTVFQEAFCYALYTLMGWGLPVLMTTAWAVVTALQQEESCWPNYNLNNFFWILEGPRLGVIVLNFLFLLNIIRVVVLKLRQSRSSEIEQVRKAVRAAVVLLPLLGITNITNLTPSPLDRAVWEFALWSYVTHFLTSFQGLFIAFLYCFLNGEVRMAVMKSVYTYLSLRPGRFHGRRHSAFSGVYVTADPGAAEPIQLDEPGCVEQQDPAGLPSSAPPEAPSPEASSPRVTSPRVTSPRVTSPENSSPRVTSPKDSSPRVTSPGVPGCPGVAGRTPASDCRGAGSSSAATDHPGAAPGAGGRSRARPGRPARPTPRRPRPPCDQQRRAGGGDYHQ